MATPTARKLAGLIVIVVIGMIPGILLTFFGMPLLGSAATLGAVSGAIASLSLSFQKSTWVAIAMGVATFLAVFSSAGEFFAVAAFALIGAFTGIMNFKGISGAYIFVPITAGFVLAQPPTLSSNLFFDGLIVGLIAAAAALFTSFLVAIPARSLPKMPAPTFAPMIVIGYAVNLALLLAITSYLTMHFALGHLGAWLMLTIVVIVQPTLHATWTKGLQRASGTILGFFIAVGVADSIPLPGLYVALGALFIVVALLQKVKNVPYWQYAMFLTPGIVMLSSSGSSVGATADERLYATFAGALICLIVLVLERPLFRFVSAKANSPQADGAY